MIFLKGDFLSHHWWEVLPNSLDVMRFVFSNENMPTSYWSLFSPSYKTPFQTQWLYNCNIMVQDHKFESIFYKFYFWAEGLFINDVITWQHTLGKNWLFVQGNFFREEKKHLKNVFFWGFGRSWRPNRWQQTLFWGTSKNFGYNASNWVRSRVTGYFARWTLKTLKFTFYYKI